MFISESSGDCETSWTVEHITGSDFVIHSLKPSCDGGTYVLVRVESRTVAATKRVSYAGNEGDGTGTGEEDDGTTLTLKLQKIEGQRRSPRLSAPEVEADHDHLLRQHLENDQGPAFRTRGRKNTKLRSLQQFTPSTNQGLKHYSHYDIQKKSYDGE
ncbi:unnamed protein product [Sphenostylis stenocarpa]|uniref:Uncharacterized protein n=1 Tax=Sphenostylis stenocarpa TaxID=92480 RepID=A0AA86VMX7_9FABA|nr:unnamed protein product [Sphenostylis stenocarpa]